MIVVGWNKVKFLHLTFRRFQNWPTCQSARGFLLAPVKPGAGDQIKPLNDWDVSEKLSSVCVFNSLACHGWHKGSIFTLAFSAELNEIPWNKFAECSGEPQAWSVLHLTSLSQRRLFLLKLLTFIGKLSFRGVRWCVIVSTADFANDTPLLVRHINWTHPESKSLWTGSQSDLSQPMAPPRLERSAR